MLCKKRCSPGHVRADGNLRTAQSVGVPGAGQPVPAVIHSEPHAVPSRPGVPAFQAGFGLGSGVVPGRGLRRMGPLLPASKEPSWAPRCLLPAILESGPFRLPERAGSLARGHRWLDLALIDQTPPIGRPDPGAEGQLKAPDAVQGRIFPEAQGRRARGAFAKTAPQKTHSQKPQLVGWTPSIGRADASQPGVGSAWRRLLKKALRPFESGSGPWRADRGGRER